MTPRYRIVRFRNGDFYIQRKRFLFWKYYNRGVYGIDWYFMRKNGDRFNSFPLAHNHYLSAKSAKLGPSPRYVVAEPLDKSKEMPKFNVVNLEID